jgi:hypothetical protein
MYKMNYIQQIDDKLDAAVGKFIKKPTIVKGVIHLLIVLYAAALAPKLPPAVMDLFNNNYFKLFVFALILWTAHVSPTTSILLAVAFMVTMSFATNSKHFWESMENTPTPTMLDSSVVAPTKDIAIDSAMAMIKSQVNQTPIVGAMMQNENTIVVQPNIVETSAGKVVVNPTVVVAPAVISGPGGEKVIIKPDVTFMANDNEVGAPVSVLAPPPPAQPMVEVPMPATPTPPAPAAPVTSPGEGCYPIRKYDMAKIMPFDSDNAFGSI